MCARFARGADECVRPYVMELPTQAKRRLEWATSQPKA